MKSFIATVVLAIAATTNALAAGAGFEAATLGTTSFSGMCMRGTCCYWGNDGSFWACVPRAVERSDGPGTELTRNEQHAGK